MNKNSFVKATYVKSFIIAIGFVALSSGEVNSSELQQTKAAKRHELTEDGIGYLRVKEYTTKPMDDSTSKGEEITLVFGDTVILKQKADSLPAMWLISKQNKLAWIPDFYLTANKREIDFLKKTNRIPSTMSFFYKEDHIKVYGLAQMGPFVVDSQGMAATAEGSSQVAFEGNAVLFHASVATQTMWGKYPIVMSCGNTTHKLGADYLYYCRKVSDDRKACFECINLRTLTLCR